MSERIDRDDLGAAGAWHASGEELALYVIDALDGARKEAIEGHLLACEGCADRLAREARIEAALEEVARLAEERGPAVPAMVQADAATRRMAAAAVVAVVPSRSEAKAPPPARRRVLERNRWAGGVVGALAAAAALVLAFVSSTPARAETLGMSRRLSLHDAADMSGAFSGETVNVDALDGG